MSHMGVQHGVGHYVSPAHGGQQCPQLQQVEQSWLLQCCTGGCTLPVESAKACFDALGTWLLGAHMFFYFVDQLGATADKMTCLLQ